MTRDLDELVALLVPASGEEQARRVVEQGCAELRLTYPPAPQDIPALLVHLSQRPGATGAAIRLATRRSATTPRALPAQPPPQDRVTLVQLLAPALGDEKAQQVVRETAALLGLDPERLTLEGETRVLDRLSNGGDYWATVARFAKTRSLLRK